MPLNLNVDTTTGLKFQQPNFNPNEYKMQQNAQLMEAFRQAPSLMLQYQQLKQQRELAGLDHQLAVEDRNQRLMALKGQYGTGGPAPTVQPQINVSPTSPLNLNPMTTPGAFDSAGSTLTAGPDMAAAPVPVEENIDQLQERIGSIGLNARGDYMKNFGSTMPGGKKGGGSDDKSFSQLQQLRTSYLTQSKDFSTIRSSYARLKSTAENPSPAGDLSMLFNYMKLLDPGSVVRESEFSNAETAAPLMTRLGLDWQKMKDVWEGKRMTPSMRQDFLSQANNIYKESVKGQKNLIGEFKRVAEQSNLDPELAVIDLFSGDDGTGGLVIPPPEGTNSSLPRVGETQDGYRFKGGNPADKKNWEKM